jgi:hypothetical protein
MAPDDLVRHRVARNGDKPEDFLQPEVLGACG